MLAATGEIVAYIDDDAYPDAHWLQYLAHAFTASSHAGIGGPNIPPAGDGTIAESVANAPGGPIHVLIADQIAEHIPGCNMAFRRDALLEVGGFDPIFRAAGDDVDICWKIQAAGKTIGFHPAAIVWHHRRNSVRAYWRQQKGYGKAEALLEEKWTQKYNRFGHATWNGRIYGNGLTLPLTLKKAKIFHGIWGSGLFQSIYQPQANLFASIPLMPEWYFIVAGLAVLSLLGFLWKFLFLAAPLLIAAIGIVLIQAGTSAAKAVYATAPKNAVEKFYRRCLTAFLHVIQPSARLYGRLTYDLTARRKKAIGDLPFEYIAPKSRNFSLWSEEWKASEEWLREIEAKLIESKTKVRRGGDFDRFDLEASVGMFAACRGLLLVEEHGAGRQLVKLRCRAHYSRLAIAFFAIFAALALFAAFDKAIAAALFLSAFSLFFGLTALRDAARATRNFAFAFLESRRDEIGSADKIAADETPDLKSVEPLFIASRRGFEKGGFK